MDVDTYAWFYKQAKRVQRLEKADIKADGWYMHYEETTRKNKRLQEQVQELEQQNKRYREALEFYADSSSYGDINERGILKDKGQKARQALEGDDD